MSDWWVDHITAGSIIIVSLVVSFFVCLGLIGLWIAGPIVFVSVILGLGVFTLATHFLATYLGKRIDE